MSDKAQYLVVFKKKSEGDVGHGPMGPDFQTDFLMEWGRISLKYLSCAQGVMVFDSSWGKKAVESANFKKKSGVMGPVPMGQPAFNVSRSNFFDKNGRA